MSDDEYNPALFDEELIDEYLAKSGRLLLQSVSMQYVTLQNTQKKEKTHDMPLSDTSANRFMRDTFVNMSPCCGLWRDCMSEMKRFTGWDGMNLKG
jgi:hypothetical protein